MGANIKILIHFHDVYKPAWIRERKLFKSGGSFVEARTTWKIAAQAATS